MVTLLFTLMIISGILFIGSVLLMAPKGGIGFGVGGMATSNEYGSKKSLEGTLKKSAILSISVFLISAMLYPYINKTKLSTKTSIQQQTKLNPENIKVELKDINGIEKEQVNTNNTTTTGN